MTCAHRLAFCLAGVLLTGCALPKLNSDYEQPDAGGKNTGGAKVSAGAGSGGSPTTTLAGGQAGRTNTVGGATVIGGAGFAGQPATTGGLASFGGAAGASVANGGVAPGSGGNASAGAPFTGGTSNTGGLSNVAGNKPTGGAPSSGGTSIAAGAPSNGGAQTGGVASGGVASGGAANVAGAAGSSGKPTATAIATGLWHSCAVLSDGTVRCWGENCEGMLSDGGAADACPGPTYPYRATPVQVQGIARASAIAGGRHHTCAIVDEGADCGSVKCGTVKCWGSNLAGQLGFSETSARSGTPVTALGISTATALVAGEVHTCALLSDTTVKCWGFNSFGQLGSYDNISEIDYPTSVVVDSAHTPLQGVTKLSAGYEHTCAIVTGGKVYCWGSNRYSQLGAVTTGNSSYVAVEASLLTTVLGSRTAVAIGAGGYFSCALLSDGSGRCWGSGTSGQLGNSASLDSDTPVPVGFSSSSPQASDLTAGYIHACAILANASQTAQCWGDNTYGEIGNGSAGADVPKPATVMTGSGASATPLIKVQAIAAGYNHSCAIAAGVPYCWGANDFGELGTGDVSASTTARPVVGF